MEIMESPDAAAAAVAAAYSSFSSSLPPLVMAPDELRRVKFLCSFGGSILPRPLDGKLRYVGGETRIVSVPRDVTYEELMVRMRDLFDGAWSLKYQQPEEDLDALISVVNDDDVTNMMEEYDKLGAGGDGFTRLRIFLFSHPDHDSGASSTSPAGAQFDSSDERETERRYVDALNSPIDPSEQFLSQRGVDPGLHAQFNTPQQASVAHRYSDTEGPRSPVYHTPGHHLLHDPRDFPPSPSSRPHHPAFGETIDRISEEYMRQTPSQPPPHHPAFVESVVWLPPGGIPAENAGFPGNLGHIHNVCEPSNVCEHCLMAVRRNQLTAPEARFHDNMNHWNHWQPHLDHMNQEGDFVGQFSNSSCIDCTQLRDPYLINQENSSLDHRVYTSTNHHLDDPRIHYTDRLPVDRIGMNFPVLHGNFYDHHHHHHHVQLASEHRNEVEGAMQYGSVFQRAHVPPPVANFSRPPYEAPGQMAGNHLNKVFPISSPTTRDNENPNFLETSHAKASKKSDGVKIPSRDELDREGMKKENSSKECSDFSTDLASSVKLINLEDHKLSKKELSLHVSETTTSQEDLDADVDAEGPAINEIEPTVAEEEALAKGLQTVKNSDLEEIRELGSGTYGSVYHGKWKGSDVAIKRIKASCFSGKPSERKRLIADFWKEALILSSLHHPNVVSFYGIVRDGPDGSLATVTEFMVNGSLKQVLQKKDRTIDRRKRIIISMDAAFGMEYLHGKNIVHFDLKCENLLVNMRDPHRPVCKIGDLGLSKVKQKTLVSGGVRGTLPWMAPELLSGKTNMVSEKVDVYSFGVVMWELLTGEEPYADMHCASIIGGIVNNTLRPTIPTWCDPEWKSLMETCWSTDPADRPSFSDVSQRLRKMAAAVNVK